MDHEKLSTRNMGFLECVSSDQPHLDAVQKLRCVKAVEDDLRPFESIRGAVTVKVSGSLTHLRGTT